MWATGDRVIDRWMPRLMWGSTLVSATAVWAIVLFLLYAAMPLLLSGEFLPLLTSSWRPYGSPAEYGIAPMIAGSLLVAFLSLLIAFPTALGACGFAHGIAPRVLGKLLLAVVHFMTSIPTVIYGFVSVCLLVPLVRDAFSTGTGFSLLTAAITLSFLILPTIVLVMDVGLRQIDPDIKLACEALGLSPAQTQLRVLFPMARRTLLVAAGLGFCRAVGDTLIALMVAGNAPQVPSSATESIRTLTSHIALVVATDWYSPEYRSVAAAGLLLFVLSAGLSVMIRRLRLTPGKDQSDATLVR